jgi:hypothetical protein
MGEKMGESEQNGQAVEQIQTRRFHLLVAGLRGVLSRAGIFKLFVLGVAIGISIGVVGGRFAERLRLADYADIEQMILDREHPDSPRQGPPRLPSPSEPARM